MSAVNAAYASFEQKWLMDYPEQTAAAVFLAPSERLLVSAFGCLIHEIEKTVFGVREASVAAVKLAWWRQELLSAADGNPHHPISTVLFSEPRAQAVDARLWTELSDSSLRLLEPRSASNIDDQFDSNAALYTAVADIECVLFGGADAERQAVASLWTITHCLRTLAVMNVVEERLSLPLDLLARHGLTRSMLAQTSAARSAALREYLNALEVRARSALTQVSSATLSRRVRARLDLVRMGQAIRSPDPLLWLGEHPHAGRWNALWSSWSEARYLARHRSR